MQPTGSSRYGGDAGADDMRDEPAAQITREAMIGASATFAGCANCLTPSDIPAN